jgi:hypothetical protein
MCCTEVFAWLEIRKVGNEARLCTARNQKNIEHGLIVGMRGKLNALEGEENRDEDVSGQRRS